jgi:hypothetical protein
MTEIRINHPTGPEPDPAAEQWTTDELREQFEVEGFAAPYVVVRRKSDGRRGSLEFVQNPGRERIYFNFMPTD